MAEKLDKYKYLRKNTALFAISSFSTKVLAFLLTPVYTALLTTEEYGIADLINTTAILMIYVLTINIADAVLRFSIEKSKNSYGILSFGLRILFVGDILSAIILFIAYKLKIFNWEPEYYLFAFLLFAATAFYQIMTNYLRGIDKVSAVAVAGVISSGMVIVSSIVFLAIIKCGIIGYLLSIMLGPLVASVYCIFVEKKAVHGMFCSNIDYGTKISMIKYSSPLIFNNIALWINGSLDKYFVTAICGASVNGIYSVAGKIPHILDACIIIFCQAWNLSAIKEFDSEDKDGFFSKTYNVYTSTMAMGCSFIILLNIPLAHFLYADNFFMAWNYSSILLIATMANTLTAFIGGIFAAAKATNIIAVTTVLSATVNIILNCVLIPQYGALGAAVATAIAYFVMFIIRLIWLRKIIKLRFCIWKGFITFFLLIVQVVCEHQKGHFYLGQALCVATLIFLNNRELKMILNKILLSIKRMVTK